MVIIPPLSPLPRRWIRSPLQNRRNCVDWPVFRPSMMRLMVDARARLVAAGENKKEVYVGDRAVAGLGKNYMTEASRLEGIETYTLHLRRCGGACIFC